MGLTFLTVFLFSCTAFVSCQIIPEILSAYPQLSSLATQLESLPSLSQQFAGANNFTFLAPTNDAFSKWLATNRSQDYIQATLEYHLLNGIYPAASLSSTPQFISTSLTNASYANVTGGQRVEVFNNGDVIFESALNTTSNVVISVSIMIPEYMYASV